MANITKGFMQDVREMRAATAARPVNRFEIDEAAVTLGNQIAEKRVLEIEHVCSNAHLTNVEKMLRIRNILERG